MTQPSGEFLELQAALAGEYSLQRELGRGGMGIVYIRELLQYREATNMRTQTGLLLLGLTVLLGGNASDALAQAVDDTTEIEIATARALLSRREPQNVSFAIDPRFGIADHPTGRGAIRAMRPRPRTAAVLAAVGGTARTLDEVRCGLCHLNGVSAHLTLTSPKIAGSIASIIGTLVQNSASAREPTYFETVRFMLSKSGTGWVITKQEQLAAS